MNIFYNPDPNLNIKPEEAIRGPVIVTVNKFDEDAVTKFRTEMAKAQNTPQEVIPVIIDSYGGHIYSLASMIDIIKSSKKPVSTIASGKAMSCGAALLACGSPGMRYITEESIVMIHDASSGSIGKTEEIKADAREIDRVQVWMYDLLDKRCGKISGYFKDEVHQRSHANWHLTAEDCLKHGVADHIGMPYFEITTKLTMKFKV